MGLIILYCLSPIRTSASELAINEQEKYESAYKYEQWERQQEALSIRLTDRATSQIGKKGGQCVVFVRNFGELGRDQVSGYARNTKTNSTEPEIGAVVVTKESSVGHVAIVIGQTDTQIQVVESNYSWNQRISTRWIDKDYSLIKGYLIP